MGQTPRAITTNFQTASYSITLGDGTVTFSCASGSLVGTLPSAVGCLGKILKVKRAFDSTPANTLNIQTVLSQTVDGRTLNNVWLQPGDWIEVQSNGTNWQTLASQETVSAKYVLGATSTIQPSDTLLDFPTKVWDTHSAVLGAGSGNTTSPTGAWRYVVPKPGRYKITAHTTMVSTTIATGNTSNMGAYQTASFAYEIAAVAGNGSSPAYRNGGSVTLQCVAGDYLSVSQASGGGTGTIGNGGGYDNWVIIEWVSD